MHFEDKKTMIAKVASLLNSNGLFCVSIDKSQGEWIDMGNRKIRIYPDTLERTIMLAKQAGLKEKKTAEVENAYLIAFMKRWASGRDQADRTGRIGENVELVQEENLGQA